MDTQTKKPQRNELWIAPSGRTVIIDSVEEDANHTQPVVKYHQVAPATDLEEMMQTARPLDNFLSTYKPYESPGIRDDYDG